VPYGVYDITNNVGWVSVGTDHDTASFASMRSGAGGESWEGNVIPGPRGF
jgi:hypothetical protein